jgi:hypothetical protein
MVKWFFVTLSLIFSMWIVTVPQTFAVEAAGRPSLVLISSTSDPSENHDQESFVSLLTILGLQPTVVRWNPHQPLACSAASIIGIPHMSAQRLTRVMTKQILQCVNDGAFLMTDGNSKLVSVAGFKAVQSERILEIIDESTQTLKIRWPDQPVVPYVTSAPAGSSVHYSDGAGHPLVMGASYGKGEILYLAPLLDPLSSRGYARFPGIPNLLINTYRIVPLFRADRGEAYFDPGLRDNIRIEDLAPLWRKWGIHTVYASAWDFYSDDTYDYGKLLRIAHANGIRVYAWLEWPHVNEKLWDDHPEWREKTATLVDANVDWRKLMNLQNPQCLQVAIHQLRTLLLSHPWDGVNVGEIYFEPVGGPQNAANFTPMDKDVRSRFAKVYGFDPLALFQEGSTHYWKAHSDDMRLFYQFRKTLANELLERVLRELIAMNQHRDNQWEIMVTAIDVASNPELSDFIGNDIMAILSLTRRYGATLQIEDPVSSWSRPPDRYLDLSMLYARHYHDRPDILDINIVPSHPDDEAGFPTATPTGTEVMQLWRTAAEAASRVCFYDESSIRPKDWELMPFVMGSFTQVDFGTSAVTIAGPYGGQLAWGSKIESARLDGDVPCKGLDSIWIPSGHHVLDNVVSNVAKETAAPRLLSSSCNIKACKEDAESIEMEYESQGRCLMLFDKEVKETQLDENQRHSNVKPQKTIFGPSGRHHIFLK